MNFLRNFFAVLAGLIVFTLLLVFVLAGTIAAIGQTEIRPVASPSVLHLPLRGAIVEQAVADPFTDALPFAAVGSTGLLQLKKAIEQAKTDDNIMGILLEPSFISTGYATLRELRELLINFQQETDKFVVAYSELYSEGDYYLASAAQQVFLHPQGNLEFNGLVAEVSFFKNLLEKLGVQPQVFRVGDYKSAVEPYLREDMSAESREQLDSYLNGIYTTYLEDVAVTRNIPVEELRALSAQMQVRNAEQALDYGLVDGLKYHDELLSLPYKTKKLEQPDAADALIDGEEPVESQLNDIGSLPLVSLNHYLGTFQDSYTYGYDAVAVIIGSGAITSGGSTSQTIGSDDFAKTIREARLDDGVKAIVLRINSPGGSALASDTIWREVKLAAKVKPVIASMGDVAASGGYYIAMAADEIVAQPNTITGSIGIFSVLFDAQKLLEEKIGITTDTVTTGELSGLYTLSRPLSEFEKSIIQQRTEEGYDAFTSKAAEGRDMPVDQLLQLAGGRVWSGSEALDNGLVDSLGSLDDAIAMAAQAAELSTAYNVMYYPKQKAFWETLLTEIAEGNIQQQVLEKALGPYYSTFKLLEGAEQYQGLQARLPYDIRIH